MALLQIETVRTKDENSVRAVHQGSKLRELLFGAMRDTLRNGGTFVVVVSETTITAVQLETATDLGDDK